MLLALAPVGCYTGIPSHDADEGEDDAGTEGAGPQEPEASSSSSEGGGTDSEDDATPEADCEPRPPGLSRLSPEQFDNTAMTLVATLASPPSEGFLGSWVMPSPLGDADGALGLPAPHVSQLMLVAEAVGAQVAEDPGFLTSCMPADWGEDACVRDFATELLRRGFRREPSPEELDSYSAFFGAQRDEYDGTTAVSMTVQRAMLAPDFLFRTELGDGGDDTMLGPFERASFLSYLIADSPPDDSLYEAAMSGSLLDSDVAAEHATRLMAERSSGAGLERFFREHVGYEDVLSSFKDTEMFPSYDAALSVSMADETREFVAHVLWEDDATFATMLTADTTLVNDRMAELYGIDGEFGDAFELVASPPERRAGILGHASFLAATSSNEDSSIVHRGLHISNELLCNELPPPPPGVDDTIPEVDDSTPQTQRERLEGHRSDPSCAACHEYIDPFGYPLEAFDAIGSYREVDNAGLSLDLSVQLPSFIDPEQSSVDSAEQLAGALANAPATYECMADHFYNFTFGAPAAGASCDAEALRAVATASDGTLLELVAALVRSETFFWRVRRGE